jgi:hypothetical protein
VYRSGLSICGSFIAGYYTAFQPALHEVFSSPA